MLTYISDTSHYKEVLSRVQLVKHMLWIGTADIKDLYVEVGKEKKPFLALIAQLIRRGVEVRLIHAKEPGLNFREDFDKYPVLYDRFERVLCPRVHFKMLVFDGKEVYIGSANLTGAGIGMKAETTRNFEAGILTDDTTAFFQDLCHQLAEVLVFFALRIKHHTVQYEKIIKE